MENIGAERNLVCVLFPGIVKNEERALECLGGIRAISQVYSHPNKKRLGLNYHPENPFMRSIHADSKKAAGVLLKIKIKKTKVNNEIIKEVISTSVVGRVKKIFKFESLCDFQYLPIKKEEGTNNWSCALDEILPTGTNNISFLKEPASLFVVPFNFTRSDKPVNYMYTEKRYSSTDGDDMHHRVRPDRSLQLKWNSFNLVDDLPTGPSEHSLKLLKSKLDTTPQFVQDYETISKLFEDKPIWSFNLIKYHTTVKTQYLKIILPCKALFMKDGPWRQMWVRYGYDPRKQPDARFYQTLDFRLRSAAGIKSMVETRDHSVHHKKPPRGRQLLAGGGWGEPPAPDLVAESTVYFRPGLVPTQRQIFYQYRCVEVAATRALVGPEPPPAALCHARWGWLPPSAADQCRDHIFQVIKQTMLATHSDEIKIERAGSSDEDVNSDVESNYENTETQ